MHRRTRERMQNLVEKYKREMEWYKKMSSIINAQVCSNIHRTSTYNSNVTQARREGHS